MHGGTPCGERFKYALLDKYCGRSPSYKENADDSVGMHILTLGFILSTCYRSSNSRSLQSADWGMSYTAAGDPACGEQCLADTDDNYAGAALLRLFNKGRKAAEQEETSVSTIHPEPQSLSPQDGLYISLVSSLLIIGVATVLYFYHRASKQPNIVSD